MNRLREAVNSIIHHASVKEVVESLLLEVECPVCEHPEHYINLAGKSDCPSKGCVHYEKALDRKKHWQPFVRDAVRDTGSKNKAKLALDAMKEANVVAQVVAKSGLDITYIFDHTHGYPLGLTKKVRDTVGAEIKKRLGSRTKLKPSWGKEEYLNNIRSPKALLYNKQYSVDFTPLLNDPSVEAWYKKNWDGHIILAGEKSYAHPYYLKASLKKKDFSSGKFLTEHFFNNPKSHMLPQLLREAAERIKSIYNSSRAAGMKKTKEVSVLGAYGHTKNQQAPMTGTVLKRNHKVFSNNIPHDVKVIKGRIIIGGEYAVTNRPTHNGAGPLPQKGDIATVDLTEVGINKQVIVEVPVESSWKINL